MSANAQESDDQEEKATKESTVQDIIYTIKPSLMLEYSFGIFRFNIINGNLLPACIVYKVIGIIISLGYSIFFCVSFLRMLSNSETGSYNLMDILQEIPIVVVIIQYVTTVISTCFFLNTTTILIFTTFMEIDKTLRVNMWKNFYVNSRSRMIKGIIMLVIISITFGATDIITDKEVTVFKILISGLYYQQNLEIFMFCNMVSLLNSRLKIINEYLARFIQNKDNSSIFIINNKEMISEQQFDFIGRISPNNMKIRDLAATYDTIGGICCAINDVFGFQIFMNLVSTFSFTVITIWTSLYYFRTPGDELGPLITVIAWCFLAICSVAVMSFTCERLLWSRSNTKLLVNDIIMDYDLPNNMRIQAKVFLELIDAWPLRVFVYDMFSVDIKLMLKFISVATTYLIVIVQISHFV